MDQVDIIPSIKSDHSAITLSFSGVEDGIRGPSFWKFNSSLVNDQDYCDLLDENLKVGWKTSKMLLTNVSCGIY